MFTRVLEAIGAFLIVCAGMFAILAWRAPYIPDEDDLEHEDQNDLPDG